MGSTLQLMGEGEAEASKLQLVDLLVVIASMQEGNSLLLVGQRKQELVALSKLSVEPALRHQAASLYSNLPTGHYLALVAFRSDLEKEGRAVGRSTF